MAGYVTQRSRIRSITCLDTSGTPPARLFIPPARLFIPSARLFIPSDRLYDLSGYVPNVKFEVVQPQRTGYPTYPTGFGTSNLRLSNVSGGIRDVDGQVPQRIRRGSGRRI
ncbi:hypothetical protein HMPREF9012_1983 [Bacteroidetes bacterium oral taxon 272 str. F0290]|nr:hypothetical protein HMPREF9012_1983 [Bacteroidetes bacterium oral taxon 272 str. F0290]